MADSASDSSFHSESLSLRQISSSLLSIHDFLVGFGTKAGSSDGSIRSPTSPLDFGVFSNSGNSVGLRCARSLSVNGHQKKWHCSKVGLGIVNSLVNDTTSGVLDIPKRKNILFGLQVKANDSNSSKHYNDSLYSSLKSKSLPMNYMVSLHPQTKNPNTQLGSKNIDVGDEASPLESAIFEDMSLHSLDSPRATSPVSLTPDSNLRSKSFCSEGPTVISSSSVIVTGSEVENSLGIKPSSLPIPIDCSQGYVVSLSAREIELSEDYTCIISHGPNPKTTHIFGDCILECHTNELSNFGKKEEPGVKSPQVAKDPEGLTPDLTDEALRFCYTCKKKLGEGEDMNMSRDDKAFCSFACRAGDIFAEGEAERTYKNSAGSSLESSDHEDIFFLGEPIG